MIWVPYQKKFFFPFTCYNLAICPVTLTKIFSTNYWDDKVQAMFFEGFFPRSLTGTITHIMVGNLVTMWL
jgi:hypothetical protein